MSMLEVDYTHPNVVKLIRNAFQQYYVPDSGKKGRVVVELAYLCARVNKLREINHQVITDHPDQLKTASSFADQVVFTPSDQSEKYLYHIYVATTYAYPGVSTAALKLCYSNEALLLHDEVFKNLESIDPVLQVKLIKLLATYCSGLMPAGDHMTQIADVFEDKEWICKALNNRLGQFTGEKVEVELIAKLVVGLSRFDSAGTKAFLDG